MGGDGSEVLGDYLGEGVEGGPRWERLYAVDLVLQGCQGAGKLSEALPGLF